MELDHLVGFFWGSFGMLLGFFWDSFWDSHSSVSENVNELGDQRWWNWKRGTPSGDVNRPTNQSKGGGRNSEKRSHLICISGRKGGLKGVVPWEQETSHLLRHILIEFDQNLPSLKQIETVNFVEQIAFYSPILKSVWLSNKIEMILTNLWFE